MRLQRLIDPIADRSRTAPGNVRGSKALYYCMRRPMARSLMNPLSAVCAALLLGSAAAYSGPETIGEFMAGDAFPLREQQDSPQLNRIVFEVSQCGPMLRSRWQD